MNEPVWLPVELVIEINRREVTEAGEPFAVLNQGLLESALQRPRNLWDYEEEGDVLVLASSLLFGIARNHPFQQGNKRTAFVAAGLFLERNGYELDAPDIEEIADLIVSIITGENSETKFIDLLEAIVTPT